MSKLYLNVPNIENHWHGPLILKHITVALETTKASQAEYQLMAGLKEVRQSQPLLYVSF